MSRSVLSVCDLSVEEIAEVVDRALKTKQQAERRGSQLSGKTGLLIFQKPSLRTRVSFELAVTNLGGRAATDIAPDRRDW